MPAAPTNLTAVPDATVPGKVFLTWNSPALPENAETITSHSYRYKLSGTDQWENWTPIAFSGDGEVSANQVTFSGLPNGVPLDFQVRAHNGDGYGLFSNIAATELGAGFGICDRTRAVRDVVVAKVSAADDCAAVTTAHLNALTGSLALNNASSTLKLGDFADLRSLAALDLSNNSLSELPPDIFNDLTSLTILNLSDNSLSELRAGIFYEHTALQSLILSNNQLDGLKENMFDRLEALLELRLRGNNLDYDDLTSDTFKELSSLTLLDLSENSLTALQDGIFSGLGNLRVLYLGGNSTDPMVLDVSLETNDQSQVRAVIPTGAPFLALVFATVTGGTFESNGGTNEVFVVPVSEKESRWVTVTSALADPVVEISTLPNLPQLHYGYVLRDSNGQTSNAHHTRMLSIADANGNEDEDIEFTISLDEAATDGVTVKYTTSVENGQTATSGTDFTAVTGGTATISAGSTSVTIPITVDDDTLEEPDETFTVTLTEPSWNARLGDKSSAVGTILDDDGDKPVVTIAAASADESAGSIDFTATMSEAITHPVWFTIVTSVASGQTATSDTDFQELTNRTHSFQPGQITKTVSIPVFNDISEESDETFTVTLTVNTVGRARPGPAHLMSAVGTILDDDDTTATVDGTSLAITFNEVLAAAPNLANDAFEVKKTPSGGSEETVTLSSSPSISGATVTLTLSNAVAHDDTVTVKYQKPSTDNDNRLEDADGNEVENFTEDVTNDTADTTAPAFDKAGVNGTLLVITFDEDLAAAPNLANDAFEVKKTPSGGSEETVTLSSSPSISGATVALTLSNAVAHDDTVTVEYTMPAVDNDNRLEDAAGNEADTFDAPEGVTNYTGDTTAPSFSSATVDGVTLVITFDEDLVAAPNLTNSAFEVKKTPSGGSEETVTLSSLPSISGATVTLTLSNAVAHDDTVTVGYTMPTVGSNNRLKDATGNEVADFPFAASVVNITNAPATGRPVVTGTAQEGETLTVDTSGIVDEDGKTKAENGDTGYAYSYQWVRVDEDGVSNPTDIGSDQDTYQLVAADVGKKIRVQVSYTDDAGNDEGPLESDATGTVTEADTTAPEFISATVDEAALVITFDEALAASSNLANDAFEVKKTPVGGIEETVTLSGLPSISGATVTLTLSNAVESTDWNVTVKYTMPAVDNDNRLEDADGNEVDTFGNAETVDNVTGDSAATGQPTITGTPRVSETLTADTGGIMDENGNSRAENGDTGYAYSYQWFRVDSDGASNPTSIGLDQSTYQLVAADAGKKIRVQVEFTDNASNAEGPLASDAYPFFGTVRGGNATGAPAITGTAQEGETLAADTSGIMDEDGKTKAENGDTGYAYSYQWFRVDSDGANNPTSIGSDQQTYQLVAADAGKKIRVQVSFTDDEGNAEGPLDSDTYPLFGTVRGGNATGAPAITGTAQEGETLTADTSGIVDGDGKTKADNGDAGYAYSYQWFRVDSDGVSNPTSIGSDQTYQLVAADAGNKIRVQVSFKDDEGNAEGPLDSDAYPGVGTVTEADTTAPSFSSAMVDEAALVITFDEALAAANLANDAFEVKKTPAGGNSEEPAPLSGSPSISGATVTLTLSDAVAYDDTVTVKYEKPSTDNDNRLEDADGNEVDTYTWDVDNNTADTTAPEFISATVDEAALVITFDEALAASSNLANDAFEVKKTPAGGIEETVTLSGLPSISGATVTLTLSNAVESTDWNVTVKYTMPAVDNDNRLEDADGNEVDTFGNAETVDNVTGDSAATGQPTITGTPRVSETLTADTGGIMDENGNSRAENGDTGYAYSYQWFRVDSDGASNPTSIGLDQSTYQLVAADAGKKIGVQVSFTDNAGYAEGPLASDAYPFFGTVRGGNATGAPAITGTAQEGETLAADTSGIMDEDGKTKAENGDMGYAYSYQWFRVDSDGANNPTSIGSDQQTYQLVAADAGKKIRVQVEFTDNAGNAEGPLDSDAYPQFGAVQGGNATGAPEITGTVQVGETLTADTSGIVDGDGKTKADNGDAGYAYSYQWFRVDSDGVSNPTSIGSDQTYQLVAADTGKKVGVQVSFTDNEGNTEGPLVSAASGPVAAPTLTASFDPLEQTVIEGENAVVVLRIAVSKQPEDVVFYRAQTNNGTADVLDDFTPPVVPRYEEAPVSEFAAQDDNSYTYERTFEFSAVADTDVEGDEVFYVGIILLGMSLNEHYDVNIVNSEDGHGALIRIREPATGAPVVTGTAQEDETLTADTGGIVDGDGKTKADNGDTGHAYSYQWVRVDEDGVSNPTDIGSDQDTYQLVAADVGKKIRVQVSYTDDAGNDEGPLESDAVPSEGGILAGNEPALGTPEIDGKAQVGQQLMADTSNIEDEDGLDDVSYDYQWFRIDSDGVSNHEKVGMNQETYMLEMGDAGKKIGVQVEFTDDAGNEEGPLDSDTYPSFGTVQGGNAKGTPAITGTPRVDETLTADTGGIMDENGNTKAEIGDMGYAYSYTWFRVDSDGVSNPAIIGVGPADLPVGRGGCGQEDRGAGQLQGRCRQRRGPAGQRRVSVVRYRPGRQCDGCAGGNGDGEGG